MAEQLPSAAGPPVPTSSASSNFDEDESCTPQIVRRLSRKFSNTALKSVVDKVYGELSGKALSQILIEKLNLQEQHAAINTLKEQLDALQDAAQSAFGSHIPADIVAMLILLRNKVRKRNGSFKASMYRRANAPKTASLNPILYDMVPVEEKEYFDLLGRYCQLAFLAYETDTSQLEAQANVLDWKSHVSDQNEECAEARVRVHCHIGDSKLHKPAHFVALIEKRVVAPGGLPDDTKLGVDNNKPVQDWQVVEVVLCVRGTANFHDAVNDLCQTTVEFSNQESELSGEVHGGMMASAKWLAEMYGDFLAIWEKKGAKITMTGHSFGAGTSALCTMHMLHECMLGSVKCFAFACPAVASRRLCSQFEDSVTSVVHDDDCVVRSCSYTILNLRYMIDSYTEHFDEISETLQQWKKEVDDKITSLLPQWWLDSNHAEVQAASDAAFETYIIDKIKRDKELRLKLLADRQICTEEDAENGNLWTTGEKKYRQLFPPGRTLHMYRQDDDKAAGDAGSCSVYSAAFVPSERFGEIEISKTLVADHLCGGYVEALATLATSAIALTDVGIP